MQKVVCNMVRKRKMKYSNTARGYNPFAKSIRSQRRESSVKGFQQVRFVTTAPELTTYQRGVIAEEKLRTTPRKKLFALKARVDRAIYEQIHGKAPKKELRLG